MSLSLTRHGLAIFCARAITGNAIACDGDPVAGFGVSTGTAFCGALVRVATDALFGNGFDSIETSACQ